MIIKNNINKDINILDNLNTSNKKEIRKFQDILNENSTYLYITFFNIFNYNDLVDYKYLLII